MKLDGNVFVICEGKYLLMFKRVSVEQGTVWGFVLQALLLQMNFRCNLKDPSTVNQRGTRTRGACWEMRNMKPDS